MMEPNISVQDKIDPEDFLFDAIRERSGVYRLWLAVLIDAVITLRDGHSGTGPARSFIFDTNPFFDYVADELGYEPEALRERVARSMKTAL